MHRAEIQAALKMRGASQADVARACGVTPATVNGVVQGKTRSRQVEECIAAMTGLTVYQLWPQWYGAGPSGAASNAALVLSVDEIELVLNYRNLSSPQRDQAQAMLKVLKLGGSPGQSTVITGSSRVAGRDYHENKSSKEKKQ